jgi:tetratricopeptide (TPR) repeat protein
MFCRSCWANLPDGTERCPKCQRDPRVPVAPPPEPSARPAVAPRPPADPPAPGRNLARLNILLAALLAALVGGPPVARWWMAPPGRSAPPPPAPATEGAPPASVEAGSVVPAAAPVAAPRGDDPDAGAAREAYALYQGGRIAEACERYGEIARRTGGDADRRALAGCQARLGRDLYQAGRPGEAAAAYRRAVEAAPEREHWIGLALAHARAGDLARAQAAAEQALRAFPEDPELLYLLADVQERQGRSRAALDTLRRLLARDAGHARGKELLARLEREQTYEAGYWSQESPHFVVRYEGAQGIDVGRSVVDSLEQAYESIGRDLGAYPRDRVQVGVYATKTFAEIGGIPPEFAEHVLGFYDSSKLRLRLSASQAGTISLDRLVRHEYTHLVIQLATRGRAPRWLHEGLAQVMEPRSAPRLVETDVSLDRQHLTLDGLERMFRSNAVGAAYQLSHILVEQLVDRRGLAGMRDFLARLGRGEPVPPALGAAFGMAVADLEERLLAAGGRS